jgi:gluconate 2-dehydrogenase gamma chain
MNETSYSRRIFIKVLAAGASLGAARVGSGAQEQSGSGVPSNSATEAKPHVWRFFNRDEARAVEAATARLIPADELGPGAKEAGVAEFLDAQLAGAWGSGDNLYRQGPFTTGTPQQGYQLSFTPAEMFRMGLAKLDEAAKAAHDGTAYADLAPAQQDAMLTQLEKAQLDFGALPSAVFFAALLDATIEGFFSDPVYGGNRDMISWKLIGFPGVYASYANDIERHGVAWTTAPVSIADGGGHHEGRM